MGGEWIFSIKESGLSSLDAELYHNKLREIKAKIERNPGNYETVEWAASESEAIQSNVFARFSYTCSRHSWHGCNGPDWKLYWDLNQVIPKDDLSSNIHARCTPGVSLSKRLSRRAIQLELQTAFPLVFELYLGDGISGYDYDYYSDDYSRSFTPTSGYYRTGNGDNVYCMQGEGPDYTACDSECGYCGRCQY